MKHYKHTVFMSYAFDDDTGWSRWISNFDQELNFVLQARLREWKAPVTLMSSKNGPVNGALSKELKRLIETSFAMIIFVHDRYLKSEWCLEELKHFIAFHKHDDAYEERLFIVAMSKTAIEQLISRPDWPALIPSPDLVWMPFLNAREQDEPVWMYMPNPHGNASVMSNDFLTPFFALSRKLVAIIRQAAFANPYLFKEVEAPLVTTRTNALPGRFVNSSQPVDVLTYIESDPEQKQFWEQLGGRVSEAWNELMAKQSEERQEPRLLLRPTGLAMRDLHERPRLDNADGVILLWGQKTEESLLAQIALVEPKLSSARPPAPCLVAYLVDDPTDSGERAPESIAGWPVVRFRTAQGHGGAVTVFENDAGILDQYLEKVLQVKLQPTPAPQPA